MAKFKNGNRGSGSNQTHRVLGIMSGTSADGIDYALCEIKSGKVTLKGLWSVNFPAKLRERILAAASDSLSTYETAQLHHDLGRFYAKHAPNVKCDYIGLHGQTVYHNPAKGSPATYQIGEPAYLAARFNVPVVNQFRTMDLALGGQGAPLATAFHKEIFSVSGKNVAVNNLGGISNVTYLSSVLSGRGHSGAKGSRKILSFDTGPANMLIDYAIRKVTHGKLSYDKNGDFAARGVPMMSLVEKWMKHPFFALKPPKSTGREDFGESYFEKLWADCRKNKLKAEDAVATLAQFTAQSLCHAYEKYLPTFPDRVVLCGGGASNPALVQMITRALRALQWQKAKVRPSKIVEVVTSEQLGWPAQSIEPAAFAFLAYCTMTDRPGNIPQTTGARRAARLGSVSPAP